MKALWLLALVGVSGFFPGISAAQAVQVTLAWEASTSPNVGGYVLYYGHASRNYTDSVDVGDQTQYTLTDLETGTTYYSLESPTQGSFESGIGLIRGWVC